MAEKEKAMKAEEKAKAEKQKKEVDPEESERAVNSEKEQDVQADAVKELEQKLAVVNDKYLRLSAEFDNYRKRTLKEKMELTKNAGEQILSGILPVVDNFERALASMEKSDDMQAIREGVKLIYNSFKEFLTQNGVTEIDCVNNTFDTDEHEAVTKIPAPSADLKGKVVDCIQKGYKLKDRVIRASLVKVSE